MRKQNINLLSGAWLLVRIVALEYGLSALDANRQTKRQVLFLSLLADINNGMRF